MSWLKCLAAFLLFLQSLSSDVKIFWSEKNINGQVLNVLYGSAVEFRCHNNTVDNLFEVSKEEYDSCEPLMNQHSLLNCTRDTPRGRDIYTALIVQHDVRDPFFKDYIIGENYYFISTASTKGTDGERIANTAGGNCKWKSMKIELHVVNSLSKSTSDISENGASSVPDPGGQDPPIEDPEEDHSSKTDVPQDNYANNNYTSALEDDAKVVPVLDTSAAADNKSSTARSILALLLLTLVYILNS